MRNLVLQRRARALRRDATDAERHLWRQMRSRQLEGYRFRRQVPIAGYIADFACLEAHVIVELDGGQHLEQQGYDEQRGSRLRAAGFRVLRFWDNDVLRETQSVVEAILAALVRSPHPGLPPQAREGELRPHPGLRPQAGEGGSRSAAPTRRAIATPSLASAGRGGGNRRKGPSPAKRERVG